MKVTSMRGVAIDMARLAAQNEDVIASGAGTRMNARGDIVGPRGQIVKTREEVANEYHQNNPKAVKNVSLKDMSKEVFSSPAEAVAALTKDQPKTAPAASKRKITDTDE